MTKNQPILVIDDDQALRDTICSILHDEGYAAVGADGGAAALAKLRSGLRPSVIILDLMMPEMNGWQFRQHQLDDPAIADIPVVVLTASRNLESRPITVDGLLYKPLTIDSLLDVIAPWAPTAPQGDGPH